ncbi:organic hydroperoxide resistance protein [Psychrosphaera sp. B3R10]|uniref:organic hydroperoxide resistance protein n=1 Tax=unclassified Psychrosphaera TaxID=2641570 RepID=UPI001C08BDC1|nr:MULTISPECIES: organic hydroperoxide resistance protein [unclassified Psychrosphaera]MBU2880554.1 organic hydroperoxide resistance protein [Psychrosphaera sp. I2R16]MBU2989125.1 organic hydroperoxide resistance protein [Psychrosphaera sp. B3R10]MDO6717781.1 organic hydroperoxide resistance protein [Psychrosphaera sp. 1_MG-2023]
MNELNSVLYTAEVTTTGGRDGASKSTDGHLDISLSTPKGLGGLGGEGTNPEQLFAAGYSACFIGALKVVMGQAKIKFPEDGYVNAKVSIGPITQGFGIEAELNISLGNIDKETATALVEKAHVVCPYSNATRGNIKVTLNVL